MLIYRILIFATVTIVAIYLTLKYVLLSIDILWTLRWQLFLLSQKILLLTSNQMLYMKFLNKIKNSFRIRQLYHVSHTPNHSQYRTSNEYTILYLTVFTYSIFRWKKNTDYFLNLSLISHLLVSCLFLIKCELWSSSWLLIFST